MTRPILHLPPGAPRPQRGRAPLRSDSFTGDLERLANRLTRYFLRDPRDGWDDDWDDGGEDYYDDPPRYPEGRIAGMTDLELINECRRQCRIHDNGVDSLPMGHTTIEDAAARLDICEAECKRRGLEWLEPDGDT